VTRESIGYVWGVHAQCLHPGATVIDNSARAEFWANALDVAFHEIVVEANAHAITLVFSNVQVDEVTDG
jgi:hypothetical protein